VQIEQAIRRFPRYHKYTIGTDIRNQVMEVVRLGHRAWRDHSRRDHWLAELIWAIDELKISIQLGSRIQAFKSFGEFEQIIRATAEVGACAGGWKRNHHKSQNPVHSAVPERAQILSGRAATAKSAGANP